MVGDTRSSGFNRVKTDTARIREAYDATGSTTQAITEGLGRTGRLITSAALILFLAFAALAGAAVAAQSGGFGP